MAKKIGYFSLSLLGLVAAFVVMNIVQSVVIFPATIKVSMEAGAQGIRDYDTIYAMVMEAAMPYIPLAVFLSHVALLTGFAIWYRFGCGKPSFKKANLKEIFAPKNLAGVVVMAIGLGYFINYALELLYPYIPTSIVEAFETVMEQAQFEQNALSLAAAVLLAPIGEELVFRGVCFYYAKKAVEDMKNRTVAFWIANVVQAIFFGVLHMNVLQATYAFLLGLVLGYVAYRFKSVIPSMIVHMVYNAFPTFTVEPLAKVLPEGTATGVVIVIVSFVVAIVGMLLIKGKKAVTVAEV